MTAVVVVVRDCWRGEGVTIPPEVVPIVPMWLLERRSDNHHLDDDCARNTFPPIECLDSLVA